MSPLRRLFRVSVALACAGGFVLYPVPATGQERAEPQAGPEIPAEVYSTLLEAVGERLGPRDGSPFQLSVAEAVSPEAGYWVFALVYSSLPGSGHADTWIVDCTGPACVASGGHGPGGLVVSGTPASHPGTPVPPGPLEDARVCGGVVGEVRSPEPPGDPLPGVQVEPLDDELQPLDRRRGTVTDAAGRFTLEPDVFPAPQFEGHLRLSAMNRSPTDVPIQVRPDRAVVLRLELPRSMPRPEWQDEATVRVESLPCVDGDGPAVPGH